MNKKFLIVLAVIASFVTAEITATEMGFTGNICMAAAPNDGTYSKTSTSISVYTESGHSKGSFAVYLHH